MSRGRRVMAAVLLLINEGTDIIPSINSDRSAIILHFNNIDRQKHGPSVWKFNASRPT